MAVPHHVYPTSLDLPDLAHGDGEPGELVSDQPEDDCALCQRGICTQRVEEVEGVPLIVHGVLRA